MRAWLLAAVSACVFEYIFKFHTRTKMPRFVSVATLEKMPQKLIVDCLHSADSVPLESAQFQSLDLCDVTKGQRYRRHAGEEKQPSQF